MITNENYARSVSEESISQNSAEEYSIDNCFEKEFSLSEDLLKESNQWVQKRTTENCYDGKRSKYFWDGQFEQSDSLNTFCTHQSKIQISTDKSISTKKTICDELIVIRI